MNEEIQTEERNHHARFSTGMWYGVCVHIACDCPFYLIIAAANYMVSKTRQNDKSSKLSLHTGWSKKVGPLHIFAFKCLEQNLIIFGTLKHFISNTALNGLFIFTRGRNYNTMKQLTPCFNPSATCKLRAPVSHVTRLVTKT